jgi:hypothetical protein
MIILVSWVSLSVKCINLLLELWRDIPNNYRNKLQKDATISWREQVKNIKWDDDDDVHLNDNKRLSGNFISLAHSNNSLQVDVLLNSNTLSWFQANQCLLILLDDTYMYLAEKQQIPIVQSWVWPDRGLYSQSTRLMRGRTGTITPPMRFGLVWFLVFSTTFINISAMSWQ